MVSTGNILSIENKNESTADSIPEQSGTSFDLAGETDVHKEGLLQRFQSAAYYRLLLLVYAYRLPRAILLEFRSLILRIQILRRTKLHEPGNLHNPRLFFHAKEYPPSCECEIACIRDTGVALAKHPWATVLDRALFLEGWDMGASAHSCRNQNGPCCCKRSKDNTA